MVAAVLLAGCAGGQGSDWARPDAAPAGFWAWLWHGALLLITGIVSFLTHDVGIYEIRNVGVGHNIGLVLGVLGVYGSSSAGVRVRVRRRHEEDLERRIEITIRARILQRIEKEEDLHDRGEKIGRKVKEKLRRGLDAE